MLLVQNMAAQNVLNKPITVAVLDTGVSNEQPSFHNWLTKGQT